MDRSRISWNDYFQETFSTTIKNPGVWESLISDELPEATNEDLCHAVRYLDRTWNYNTPRAPGIRAFISAYLTMMWERQNKLRSTVVPDRPVHMTEAEVAEGSKVWKAIVKATCESLKMQYKDEGRSPEDHWDLLEKNEQLDHLIAKGRAADKAEAIGLTEKGAE